MGALRWLAVAAALACLEARAALTLELYVDTVTKQVYTEPGPNRVKLGVFQRVDDPAPALAGDAVAAQGSTGGGSSAAANAPTTAVATPTAPLDQRSPEWAAEHAVAAVSPAPAPKVEDAPKWYDRYSIRGYTQFRYNQLLDEELDDLAHHADRSVGEDQSLFIRRARLILSGNINDRMSLYLQPDFAVTPSGSSTTHFVQLRDLYADIAFDQRKEFRVRVGQSKVPYSFENLQSSQNRLPLDRNDATNSCCKDERDIGAFLYWAPEHIRTRFKDLVASGLKGSGDYGVVALGIYNGQGANRFERNDAFHVVGRFTWPYQFANGQIVEAGVQAVNGRFTPTVDPGVAVNAPANGFQDARVGLHAVLYPQPFGLQAEWNWGRGPQLSPDQSSVDVEDLSGGYVQASYRMDHAFGIFMPFIRWQHYDGAMKFERNAPAVDVDETEFGLEWQPMPELELVAMYVLTDRTNALEAPYEQYEGDLLRMQLQWNY